MGDPYTDVSVTGYNSNPPSDDGSNTAANEIKWATHKTKIGDPLNTAISDLNTNVGAAVDKLAGGITSTGTNYTVVSGDQGKTVKVTASSVTITTPDATDVGSPFKFKVLNTSAGNVTVDGNGSQTIDGNLTITLPAGTGVDLDTDGTNWFSGGLNFRLGTLPRGYIDGCTISNGTDTTNDINIAAGVCRDSTNTVDITVAAMSGKQLDANWVAGANSGMRNSASGITDTTYHIYAVATAAGTQDIYAHTSTTVSTVLTALQAESNGSSYIYARRIASIIRASSAILQFTQTDNEFMLTTPVRDVGNATPGTSANTGTLASVPSGLAVKALLNGETTNANAVYISPIASTDSAPTVDGSSVLASFSSSGSSGTPVAAAQLQIRVDTSQQFRYRCTTNVGVYFSTLGWIDTRGANA